MLVIEIDGGVHSSEGVQRRDAERETYLQELGWRVLRIDALTAMSADHVMAIVTEALGI
jgi:very-short-patch-repair endonuclease